MLTLHQVSKSFGPTLAVDDVSFVIEAGEIVGIVGENGAGKTTLMRLIAGELRPDAGSITIGASSDRLENVGGPKPVAPSVGFVHQHFMLVGHFSVAENLALALPDRFPALRSSGRLRAAAEAIIAASGIDFPGVDRRAADLSVGEKSKLELIKAIARRPSLLILDEPTSVLTPRESEELFRVMRRLAAAGTAVAFISHKLREVMEATDRVIVMRRGAVVVRSPTRAITARELAAAMVATVEQPGRPSSSNPRRGVVILAARHLRGERIDDADLVVHDGEIVVIVGVTGNGQSELAELLTRLKTPRSGEIVAPERVAYIPEDRTRDGVVGPMTIAQNLALRADRWNAPEARRNAERAIERYSIRASSPLQAAGELSGGNQQKVVLARELERRPEAIVAAEPTRGLDLESAAFVHRQLRERAAGGAAVLVITSDLDEAFALADAIHVIYRGRISARLSPDQAGQVANLMAGVA